MPLSLRRLRLREREPRDFDRDFECRGLSDLFFPFDLERLRDFDLSSLRERRDRLLDRDPSFDEDFRLVRRLDVDRDRLEDADERPDDLEVERRVLGVCDRLRVNWGV